MDYYSSTIVLQENSLVQQKERDPGIKREGAVGGVAKINISAWLLTSFLNVLTLRVVVCVQQGKVLPGMIWCWLKGYLETIYTGSIAKVEW